MSGNWHLDEERIEDYRSGEITSAAAASVEQHVVACEAAAQECRRRSRPTAPSACGAGIAAAGRRAGSPSGSSGCSGASACGEPTSRLLAATPVTADVRGSFGVGIVLLLSIGAAHASTSNGVGIFLILAPDAPDSRRRSSICTSDGSVARDHCGISLLVVPVAR